MTEDADPWWLSPTFALLAGTLAIGLNVYALAAFGYRPANAVSLLLASGGLALLYSEQLATALRELA